MNPQPIRFHHRGAVVEINGPQPTRTVLDWLREDARCTGTKEGCNEGDCGACTVVIGELAPPGDASAVQGLSLRTVNACLQFLPTLDGKALFTVEDVCPSADEYTGRAPEGLRAGSGAAQRPARETVLHPAQQAMVDCHGSQCGFCTPGFVMSLWSVYQQHQAAGTRPGRRELAHALSGNLCRCTGYRPILDAGERMFELPVVRLDAAPVVQALQQLRRDDGFHYAAYNRQLGGSERVQHFRAPRTLEALAALREYHPDAMLLAGGTDIGLWVNKQFRPLGDMLYLGEVHELQRIDEANGELVIGAGVPLEAAWRTLAERVPALVEVWLRFASPPIRHAGTMGGNIANGSPIGDAAPVLMALDAQLLLRRGTRLRRVALAEFYLDYMKNQLHAGELVQAIAVPLAALQRAVRAYKISKRFDSDISAVCAAFSIELDGERVRQVRLAFGGMAATVRRASAAEAALTGRPWSQASVALAQAALAHDFTPLSDMRASAAYRLQVAQNLLQRFWCETRATDPLPAEATSVWQVLRTPLQAAS